MNREERIEEEGKVGRKEVEVKKRLVISMKKKEEMRMKEGI